MTNCTDKISSICENTPGSYICFAKPGFRRVGTDIFENINECETNNGGCNTNANCTDTVGSFTCKCKDGYTGDGYKICQGYSI